MKTRYVLPFISIALGLSGCATSPVPVANNFPITTQKVARTAQHWDVVANSIVEQTVSAISTNPELQKRSIFVPRIYGAGSFDNSFRNFLINHLVSSGMSVSVCKADSRDVDISYEAQIISHKGTAGYRPGEWIALGTGVAALFNTTINSHSEVWAAGVGLGALAEIANNSWPASTNTELIVTTTIAENNHFIFRRSDIYYVPDEDAALFFQRIAQRSTCPEDRALVSESQMRDPEVARRELFLRDMARSNPQYKP